MPVGTAVDVAVLLEDESLQDDGIDFVLATPGPGREQRERGLARLYVLRTRRFLTTLALAWSRLRSVAAPFGRDSALTLANTPIELFVDFLRINPDRFGRFVVNRSIQLSYGRILCGGKTTATFRSIRKTRFLTHFWHLVANPFRLSGWDFLRS